MPPKNSVPFLMEALDGFTSLLGPEHRCTVTITMNIARTEFSLGSHTDSEASMLDVLDTYRTTLGVEHPCVGVAKFHCGMLLASRFPNEDIFRARDLFLEASDCFLKAFGPRHLNYIMSICMLVRVLESLQQSRRRDLRISVGNVASRLFCWQILEVLRSDVNASFRLEMPSQSAFWRNNETEMGPQESLARAGACYVGVLTQGISSIC
jgi:hypothetical protein